MGKQQKVLFLPDPKMRQPWQNDVVAAVGTRHDMRIFDYAAPMQPQFAGAQVVIDFGGSMGTRAMADAAASVKLWQILGTGFDHFDLPYWQEKGIVVANCPGTFTAIPLAECAMMFMLLLARRWRPSQISLQNQVMCLPMGEELGGRHLVLVGFGASARELARRARGFGMKISAIDVRDISAKEQQDFGLEFAGKPSDLDQLVRECDYLSLHLHLNNETRHIIDGPRLKLMNPTSCLINVARGELVDETALYSALAEKRLAGAGLDVFGNEPVDPASPLLMLANVVATPHIAGVTTTASRRRAGCAAENVDRISEGLEPLYRVDQ